MPTAGSERKQAVVVVNPAARRLPRKAQLDEADAWLHNRGWSVEWVRTSAPGEATRIAAVAAGRGVPLLIVAGGDGTINEAVNGLAGTETALAVIPAGTVNLWAREAGLLKPPVEAVRLAVEGVRRRVDLGKAGERYFLLMAGVGLDGAVAHGVSHGLKRRMGAAAYAVSALRAALTYRPTRTVLSFDGEERAFRLYMLIAGNTRKYAGLSQITTRAHIDDGLLDICAYTGRGRWEVFWLAFLTLIREHGRSKNVIQRRVRELRIATHGELPVQIDGDASHESTSVISVAPGALWVVVPRGLRNPLFGGHGTSQ
jgi:YegS/Rv2252/BmrU family lipid kinase